MAQQQRQRNLLAAENFEIVYDSFKESNFKSYDYDTVRQTLIDYMRRNYGEQFNDWIKSSELVAIIEMLAFIAGNISYRNDLAVRENFLSTAQMKSSIIRLARFVGYSPLRNLSASGLMKIISIKTNEPILGIDGETLKDRTVSFFDPDDSTSYQNFILLMNAVFQRNNKFGDPVNKGLVNGVSTEEYIVSTTDDSPVVYPFNAPVNDVSQKFEIHPLRLLAADTLREPAPATSPFTILYKNDLQGIDSNETGFFVGFKQGTLNYNDFVVDSPVPNMVLDIPVNNINNSDVWVQTVDDAGNVLVDWEQVSNVAGTNAIFNLSVGKDNVYSVVTGENNSISVKFGDGNFANLPRGIVRVWYRVSLDLTYTLPTDSLQSIGVSFDYIGANGGRYRARIVSQLQDPVSNASAGEPIETTRKNASETQTVQDRMIAATDYNVLPSSIIPSVLKVKTINRTHSGHSRFMDINDPTAQTSDVITVADDAYVYRNYYLQRDVVDAATITAPALIDQFVAPMPVYPETVNFYYSTLQPTPYILNTSPRWQNLSTDDLSSGYLIDNDDNVVRVGGSGLTNEVRIGSIIEFIEPPYSEGVISAINVVNGGIGYVGIPTVTITGTGTGATATANFDPLTQRVTSITVTNGGTGYRQGTVVTITGGGGADAVAQAVIANAGTKWARVVSTSNDGLGISDSTGAFTGISATGTGAVVLSEPIPQDAKITRTFPTYSFDFSQTLSNTIGLALENGESFGLRYNISGSRWEFITAGNLSPVTTTSATDFSLQYAGNNSLNQLDNSWIFHAQLLSGKWQFTTRNVEIIIGSEKKLRFFSTSGRAKMSSRTMKLDNDRIRILRINNRPMSPFPLTQDYDFYISKYQMTPDGLANDVEVAVTYSDPTNNRYPRNPMVFEDVVGTEVINIESVKVNGVYMQRLSSSNGSSVGGRKNLDVKWYRIAANNKRVDPSPSNVHDVMFMSRDYDTKFRQYLNGVGSKPEVPVFNATDAWVSELNLKKSASDTISFSHGKYTVLFGQEASPLLRARFSVVKQRGSQLTDSEIQSRIVRLVNEFFDITNWDFGETFYFTELASYIHTKMAGNISSVAIVPTAAGSVFGKLFQVDSDTDSLWVPQVDTKMIEIVDRLTTENIRIGS